MNAIRAEAGLDSDNKIGKRIRAARASLGLTLRQVSERSGVPVSTISKVEKGQRTSVDTLVKITRGLGVLFEALLRDDAPSNAVGGRRTVDPTGSPQCYQTELYDYEVHASELTRKFMFPLIITVKTHEVPPEKDWSTHAGEEFLYVQSGVVDLHTEFYAPVRLKAGESAYFDSKMRHAYVSTGDEDAVVMSICAARAVTGMGADRWAPIRSTPYTEASLAAEEK